MTDRAQPDRDQGYSRTAIAPENGELRNGMHIPPVENDEALIADVCRLVAKTLVAGDVLTGVKRDETLMDALREIESKLCG